MTSIVAYAGLAGGDDLRRLVGIAAVVEVLPTGVEPTGVEPTGVEPTGTSCSVSDGNAWPVVAKPTPLSSIGVEPTGVEPTGVEKNDCVAGLLTVRSKSAPAGTLRNTATFVPARQPVEAQRGRSPGRR